MKRVRIPATMADIDAINRRLDVVEAKMARLEYMDPDRVAERMKAAVPVITETLENVSPDEFVHTSLPALKNRAAEKTRNDPMLQRHQKTSRGRQ